MSGQLAEARVKRTEPIQHLRARISGEHARLGRLVFASRENKLEVRESETL